MIALSSLPLLFTLCLAPVDDGSPATDPPDPEAPSPTLEQPALAAALERLAEADDAANVDPAGSTEALREAITELEDLGPELAGDEEARRLRMYARLNLARAYMLTGDDELAAAAMDEAIREAMGAELPAVEFGPKLEELYTQRIAALEDQGRAILEVDCQLACTVYVDELEVGPEPPPLVLGTYRVWIESPTKARPPVRKQVELTEAGQTLTLEFAPPPQPVSEPEPEPVHRIMPRWAEVTLLVVGAGLATTGGVLAGLEDASDGQRIGGVVALAASGIALTTGIVTLSIDERRLAGRVGRQATLSWTTRF